MFLSIANSDGTRLTLLVRLPSSYDRTITHLSSLTGVDRDQKTRQDAVYRIVGPGHKGWSRNVDSELGNYDFLLGIDVSVP